jgi:hypothetical protein
MFLGMSSWDLGGDMCFLLLLLVITNFSPISGPDFFWGCHLGIWVGDVDPPLSPKMRAQYFRPY